MSAFGRNYMEIGEDADPNKNWVIKIPDTPNGDLLFYRGTIESLGALRFTMTAAGILKPETPQLNSMKRLVTSNGYGSTNTCIRRFVTLVEDQGTDISYVDSPTLGALFTINTTGVYAISYSDSFSASSDLGISVNSNQLTTSILTITAANRLANTQSAGANYQANVSVTKYLTAGDLIRPHASTTGAGASNASGFTITKVG